MFHLHVGSFPDSFPAFCIQAGGSVAAKVQVHPPCFNGSGGSSVRVNGVNTVKAVRIENDAVVDDFSTFEIQAYCPHLPSSSCSRGKPDLLPQDDR